MSIKSALYSSWDIFKKNCDQALGFLWVGSRLTKSDLVAQSFIHLLNSNSAETAQTANVSNLLLNFAKSNFLGFDQGDDTESAGFYETYQLGKYNNNDSLPEYYKDKHSAFREPNLNYENRQYHVKVGLTHIEDKLVNAMVVLPFAVLESVWFLSQVVVCALTFVGSIVLAVLVPLILLFSLQPRAAATAFMGFLAATGLSFMAAIYNLFQAPFRLIKAVAKILALPFVGVEALLNWLENNPVNPLTISKQQELHPEEPDVSNEQPWFSQDQNQYAFTLVKEISLPVFPQPVGFTLVITDETQDKVLGSWVPLIGELFNGIKNENNVEETDIPSIISRISESGLAQKNYQSLEIWINQLSSRDEETRKQALVAIQQELNTIDIYLLIRPKGGSDIKVTLTAEAIVAIVKPLIEPANLGNVEIDLDFVIHQLVEAMRNPAALQRRFFDEILPKILPEPFNTSIIQGLVKTAATESLNFWTKSNSNRSAPSPKKTPPHSQPVEPVVVPQNQVPGQTQTFENK